MLRFNFAPLCTTLYVIVHGGLVGVKGLQAASESGVTFHIHYIGSYLSQTGIALKYWPRQSRSPVALLKRPEKKTPGFSQVIQGRKGKKSAVVGCLSRARSHRSCVYYCCLVKHVGRNIPPRNIVGGTAFDEISRHAMSFIICFGRGILRHDVCRFRGNTVD